MTPPDPARLFAAMEATWPPAGRRRLGPVVLRDGAGGGSRVSCATVEGAVTPAQIEAAEAAMQAAGMAPLWQIGPGAEALDAALAGRGYAVMDPVVLYLAPIAVLAVEPPRVAAFAHWPPLAIQRDLWAAEGIGPTRLAVMERAAEPKAALLARLNDRPAGAGFVAVADRIAYVHALAVPEAFRRRGAARNMMQRAAVWAREAGADWLALAVTRANGAGNGLYTSLGMSIVEQYHYRILTKARA